VRKVKKVKSFINLPFLTNEIILFYFFLDFGGTTWAELTFQKYSTNFHFDKEKIARTLSLKLTTFIN